MPICGLHRAVLEALYRTQLGRLGQVRGRLCSELAPALPELGTRRSRGLRLVQVSAECQDLLRGMLQPDPGQGLPLTAVLRHPWALRQLPPGYSALSDVLLVCRRQPHVFLERRHAERYS